MQDVHITCKWDQLQPMVQALEEQFEAQKEEVTVLEWSTSYKKEAGYVVLEWEEEVDTAFIDQLTADNDVEDFSVYTVPCITDNQLCILQRYAEVLSQVNIALDQRSETLMGSIFPITAIELTELEEI